MSQSPLPLYCLISIFKLAPALLSIGGVFNAQGQAVGNYLYANPQALRDFKGSLTVQFTAPANRLVIAYGRQYRKDRAGRSETTEPERELFKPVLAEISNSGQTAHFVNLAPDFYDLIIFNLDDMTLREGLKLHNNPDSTAGSPEVLAEVKQSLAPAPDSKRLVDGWESFFDTKDFLRLESDGETASVLIQQMRLGTALTGAGNVIQGCIHSLDIVWMEKAQVKAEAGWRVITRQQLYRAELPARHFFKTVFDPQLQAIRIGLRARQLQSD